MNMSERELHQENRFKVEMGIDKFPSFTIDDECRNNRQEYRLEGTANSAMICCVEV